jgi:hypothetical protein
MNGGKLGVNKKSNAHLNITSNGTLGAATHGYGPITNNMLNIKSHNSGSNQGYSYPINFKGSNNNTQNNSKEMSNALSKINGKLKKRAITNNMVGL